MLINRSFSIVTSFDVVDFRFASLILQLAIAKKWRDLFFSQMLWDGNKLYFLHNIFQQ